MIFYDEAEGLDQATIDKVRAIVAEHGPGYKRMILGEWPEDTEASSE